jgi:hypothetical protein
LPPLLLLVACLAHDPPYSAFGRVRSYPVP